MEYRFDDFERSIESTIEQCLSGISAAADLPYDGIDSSQQVVNICLPKSDMNLLKAKSAVAGLSEQVLMTSVLHRFALGKLIDEDSVVAAFQMMRPR